MIEKTEITAKTFYYNAAIIVRKEKKQFRIVRDKCRHTGDILIKLPGGMEEKCDREPEATEWLAQIVQLLVYWGFDQGQIDEIQSFEQNNPRDIDERGVIREILEEVGLYVPAVKHVHYSFREANARKKWDNVHYNFWGAEKFIAPNNPKPGFASPDQDIEGSLWLAPEELNSALYKIYYTHKEAKDKALKLGVAAEQISAYEL